MLEIKKGITLVNIDEENLHIFWTAWGISMRFSGKMWLMTILKFTRKTWLQTISSTGTFRKMTEGGDQTDPLAFLGLSRFGGYIIL